MLLSGAMILCGTIQRRVAQGPDIDEHSQIFHTDIYSVSVTNSETHISHKRHRPMVFWHRVVDEIFLNE